MYFIGYFIGWMYFFLVDYNDNFFRCSFLDNFIATPYPEDAVAWCITYGLVYFMYVVSFKSFFKALKMSIKYLLVACWRNFTSALKLRIVALYIYLKFKIEVKTKLLRVKTKLLRVKTKLLRVKTKLLRVKTTL